MQLHSFLSMYVFPSPTQMDTSWTLQDRDLQKVVQFKDPQSMETNTQSKTRRYFKSSSLTKICNLDLRLSSK